MQEVDIEITHEAGLHLRPAALFVQTASQYDSKVEVRNVTRDTPYKNAKSSLEVMMLGVSHGHVIAIRADGDDEEEAVAALQALVESDFEAPTEKE